MSTISVSLPADGETADVADYNTPINTIVNEINGNLDNANIKSGAAIAGSKLADDSVPAGKLDFGGSGVGIWWEEIGRTTLSSAGDTMSVASIPARKYLKVYVHAIATGGTISTVMRFNNDSGNNYSHRTSSNGGADSSSASQSGIGIGTAAENQFNEYEIINLSAQEKQVIAHSNFAGTAGAANNTGRIESNGKWANTSAQITRIDIVNGGTGDYAIGSEVIVLGHD